MFHKADNSGNAAFTSMGKACQSRYSDAPLSTLKTGITVRLALFDLDNTLLGGDSNFSWGSFICRHGLVDAEAYQARNRTFHADYAAGRLDMTEYQNFSQGLLSRVDMTQLAQWHRRFMTEVIEPMILAKGETLLQQHREAGDKLVMITATNRFITAPIAERLGVDSLIATECGMENGRYTGRIVDTPCFQQGKVTRLNTWLAGNDLSLQGSYFYSDSHNDLPLLEAVDNPVAVDPDEILRETASARGWPVISLR